jgi:hypothetical protein
MYGFDFDEHKFQPFGLVKNFVQTRSQVADQIAIVEKKNE